MAAGKQRIPQGEGCRWLLMPGGGRREVRGQGCMWLEWLLQARQGEVGQFEATMRVGVVLLGRVERDWIAIGWRLESPST